MTKPRSVPSSLPRILPLIVLLAGCAAPASGPSSEIEPGPTVFDLDGEQAPVSPWSVGQWLQYEVKTLLSQAGKVNAVFDGERFIADRRPWALEEASRDVPILGGFDPATLGTTAFGHPWEPLDLPLADGKTWTATLPILDAYGQPVPRPVEFTAKAGTVFLPGRQEPGFTVEGRIDGNVSVEMSYSPSLHLPTYIRLRQPGADETTWAAELREDGKDWVGPVWAAESQVLVADYALMAPNTADPTAPYADALLSSEFTGPPAGVTVFGYLVSVAFAGTAHLQLSDPDGKAVSTTALGAPLGVEVRVVDTAGKPGTWTVTGVGLGAVAFAAAYLWAVELRPSMIGADDAV